MLVKFPMNSDLRLQYDEKVKRLGEICSRWRTRLRSCVPEKRASMCILITFSHAGIKTMRTQHSCPAFPASTHRITLSTMLLLLDFITFSLGHSNGEFKFSVKFLQADVDSIEDIVISSILTHDFKVQGRPLHVYPGRFLCRD